MENDDELKTTVGNFFDSKPAEQGVQEQLYHLKHANENNCNYPHVGHVPFTASLSLCIIADKTSARSLLPTK